MGLKEPVNHPCPFVQRLPISPASWTAGLHDTRVPAQIGAEVAPIKQLTQAATQPASGKHSWSLLTRDSLEVAAVLEPEKALCRILPLQSQGASGQVGSSVRCQFTASAPNCFILFFFKDLCLTIANSPIVYKEDNRSSGVECNEH